jgi:hypothetical protein
VRRAPLSFLIALSACATHRQSAVALDTAAQQEEESHAAESVEIHRIEEPSRTTTTVSEYEGSDAAELVRAPDPSDVPAVLPLHGKLIRLTTTVEERGKVSETTSAKGASEATAAATTTVAAKADSERDSKPSLGLPVLGLVLAGIAAAAIFTRGVWLGPLVSFIRGKL